MEEFLWVIGGTNLAQGVGIGVCRMVGVVSRVIYRCRSRVRFEHAGMAAARPAGSGRAPRTVVASFACGPVKWF